MAKLIKLRLPDDLEKRARELAGDKRLDLLILEALREKWFSSTVEEIEVKRTIIAEGFPVIGSIPVERHHG